MKAARRTALGGIAICSSMQNKVFDIGIFLRNICAASALLLLSVTLCSELQAEGIQPGCPLQKGSPVSQIVMHPGLPAIDPPGLSRQLIVIGFMGGDVRGNNLVHREALLAKDLQQRYPLALHAAVFANRDGHAALESVLRLLDKNRDGCLSAKEKNDARVVIYGHSWGASETITLARRLNKLSIPVLLTIQVDSVQKLNENDELIPPNVREAINFYQLDGLLHGRSFIEAMDPKQTTVLGSFESTYKKDPVSCAGYPWYARAFMKSHIEIENDPVVWNRIEALIQTKVDKTSLPNARPERSALNEHEGLPQPSDSASSGPIFPRDAVPPYEQGHGDPSKAGCPTSPALFAARCGMNAGHRSAAFPGVLCCFESLILKPFRPAEMSGGRGTVPDNSAGAW